MQIVMATVLHERVDQGSTIVHVGCRDSAELVSVHWA
jgi:hypothetical protein